MKKADLPEGVDRMRIAYYRFPQLTVDKCSTTKLRKKFNDLVRLYTRRKPSFLPATKGGLTVVQLFIDREGWNGMIEGVAKCSLKDTFCYRKGREIALAQAIYNAKKKELL